MIKNQKLLYIPNDLYSDETYILSMSYSYDCNMRCSYCIQGVNKKDEVISNDRVEFQLNKFIDIMKYKKGKIVFDLMGGEVTQHPYLYIDSVKKVVKKLKNKFKFNVLIGTNGYDIKSLENMIDILNDIEYINKIQISISLDISKEIHNKHRRLVDGSDSYDIIKDNIEVINKKYKKFRKVNIKLSSVVNDINSISYENILNILKLGDIKTRALTKNNYTDNDVSMMKKYADSILKIYKEQLDGTITNNRLYYCSFGLENIPKMLVKDLKFCVCDGSRFHLNSDGNMYSCGTVGSEVRDIDKELFLIHDDKNFNDISKVCSAATTNVCAKCNLSNFCRKACFYYNSTNCIPWRRKQAEIMRDMFKELIKHENFTEKLINYIKSLGNESGLKNIDSLIEYKESFVNDLMEVLSI